MGVVDVLPEFSGVMLWSPISMKGDRVHEEALSLTIPRKRGINAGIQAGSGARRRARSRSLHRCGRPSPQLRGTRVAVSAITKGSSNVPKLLRPPFPKKRAGTSGPSWPTHQANSPLFNTASTTAPRRPSNTPSPMAAAPIQVLRVRLISARPR